MTTLILKIRMNSDWCIDDKEEILKALQVLTGYTHQADISNRELIDLMNSALQFDEWPIGEAYEIVED